MAFVKILGWNAFTACVLALCVTTCVYLYYTGQHHAVDLINTAVKHQENEDKIAMENAEKFKVGVKGVVALSTSALCAINIYACTAAGLVNYAVWQSRN